MKNEKLYKKLNSPVTPDALESKILSNWQDQIIQKKSVWRQSKKLAYSMAASFCLVFIISNNISFTPEIIIAAVSDIIKDSKNDIGISVSYEQIRENEGIHSFKNMLVKMTKYCTLNNKRMLHVKVDGVNQGSAHFFVNHGSLDLSLWQSKTGQEKGMIWKVIKLNEKFSVLVIYTENMRPATVDTLIQNLFYA